MMIRELSDAEFRATFAEPMREIDPETIGDVVIGDYVARCIVRHRLNVAKENLVVEHVYLSGTAGTRTSSSILAFPIASWSS